jgi:ketosteroid isomerase-like protein
VPWQQVRRTGNRSRRSLSSIAEGLPLWTLKALTAIWDQDYDNIIYIPQERPQPVRGWVGVEHYYNSVAELFDRVRTMTVRDVSVDVFGDVAYAYCIFHCEGEMQGKRHIADGRNTFLLRRSRGSWKVIHYH